MSKSPSKKRKHYQNESHSIRNIELYPPNSDEEEEMIQHSLKVHEELNRMRRRSQEKHESFIIIEPENFEKNCKSQNNPSTEATLTLEASPNRELWPSSNPISISSTNEQHSPKRETKREDPPSPNNLILDNS